MDRPVKILELTYSKNDRIFALLPSGVVLIKQEYEVESAILMLLAYIYTYQLTSIYKMSVRFLSYSSDGYHNTLPLLFVFPTNMDNQEMIIKEQ